MRNVLLALLCWTFLSNTGHAQTCTPNNNSDFSISGSTLTGSNLSASTYTAGVAVTMPGASNSGIGCYTVTVTTQTVGSGGLPGSILPACPRGCTWTNIYNSDFTTATTFDYAFNPDVTHGHPGSFDTTHAWEIPPDGSAAEEAPSATEACTSMIDTSTLTGGGNGYLSIHAVGTIPWETAGAMVCSEMAPVAGAAGHMPGTVPGGCGFDCAQLTAPVFYEAKVWAAPNQIFESILSNICTSADKGRPCSPVTTRPQFSASNMFWNFMEARGNNTDVGGNFTQIFNDSNHSNYVYGPTEGWFANGSGLLAPAPHVMGYMIDPNGSMAMYWDGTQTVSGDLDNCATGPNTTCFANLPVASWWWFDWATMTGTPGGTSKIYFVRAYQGM